MSIPRRSVSGACINNHSEPAGRPVIERWLEAEPELRLQLVRQDGDRLVKVPRGDRLV
jgi:hypothetical protein